MTKQDDLLKQIDDLKDKLNKAQRQVSGLRQKSKYLEMQYDDAKSREGNTNDLVMELLERQRELNVMLNRANIMLNRSQEAMALSSMELNEMAKALPEPKKAEWADRVAKVNELFKKTGIQDAEIGALESINPPHAEDGFSRDEMKKESEEAFGRKHSIWSRDNNAEPPRVEAEIVEDHKDDTQSEKASTEADEILVINNEPEASVEESVDSDTGVEIEENTEEELLDEDKLVFGPRLKSWWQKIAG